MSFFIPPILLNEALSFILLFTIFSFSFLTLLFLLFVVLGDDREGDFALTNEMLIFFMRDRTNAVLQVNYKIVARYCLISVLPCCCCCCLCCHNTQ